jgi:hypothetical protein
MQFTVKSMDSRLTKVKEQRNFAISNYIFINSTRYCEKQMIVGHHIFEKDKRIKDIRRNFTKLP